MLNPAKTTGVHLVTADQCMYGLTTPSSIDGSPAPAKKATKFITSSIHMAEQLQTRCDRSHVHRQLVGGRCKEAAYYPLELIRAILQGIKDTAMATQLAKEEFVQTLMALSKSDRTPGQKSGPPDKPLSSKVP